MKHTYFHGLFLSPMYGNLHSVLINLFTLATRNAIVRQSEHGLDYRACDGAQNKRPGTVGISIGAQSSRLVPFHAHQTRAAWTPRKKILRILVNSAPENRSTGWASVSVGLYNRRAYSA